MKKLFHTLLGHWVLTLIGIVVLLTGAYFLFKKDTPVTSATKTEVKTVEKGTLKVTVTGSGQVAANAQVDLKPVAAGDAIEVISVSVKNDQAVTKGQIIATLDSEDALRNVQQAELSLKSAKIKMQQTEEDFKSENTTDTLTRRAQETVVKEQEIALADARSELSDYTIRAPFDGIVTGLSVNSGDTTSQTTVLASVITRDMKAVISLNEVDAAKVAVGNSVTLSFDAVPATTLTGTISKLDSIGVATQGVVSYGAEIEFTEQSPLLKPGMSVAAEIAVAQKDNVVLVPNAAITTQDGQSFVTLASSSQSSTATNEKGTTKTGAPARGEKRAVTLGITDNVNTEILSGLSGGEKILITSASTASAATSTSSTQQGSIFSSLLRGGNTRSGGNTNR